MSSFELNILGISEQLHEKPNSQIRSSRNLKKNETEYKKMTTTCILAIDTLFLENSYIIHLGNIDI